MASKQPSWTYNKVKQFYSIPVDGLNAYFSNYDLHTSLLGSYKNDKASNQVGIVSCYLKKPASLAFAGNRCVINDLLRSAPLLKAAKGLPKNMRKCLEQLLTNVEDRRHLRI